MSPASCIACFFCWHARRAHQILPVGYGLQIFFEDLARDDSFMGSTEPAVAMVKLSAVDEVVGVVVGHRMACWLPQLQDVTSVLENVDDGSHIVYVMSLGVRDDVRCVL